MGRLPFVRQRMSLNFEGVLRLRCGQQEAVLFRCVLSELAIGVIPFLLSRRSWAMQAQHLLYQMACFLFFVESTVKRNGMCPGQHGERNPRRSEVYEGSAARRSPEFCTSSITR